MADTTFRTVLPPLKAIDNGDGTFSVAIVIGGNAIPLPVLTTIQRDALTPAAGWLIYNSTTGQAEIYNGADWVAVGSLYADAAIVVHTADADAHHEVMPTNHKAMAHPNANQSINSGSTTKVTLDVEDYDPGNHFASDKYTVAKAGFYLIAASAAMGANLADGKVFIVYIYVDGVAVARSYLLNGASGKPALHVVSIVELAVDAYIELHMYHAHGSALDNDKTYTSLAVHLLST